MSAAAVPPLPPPAPAGPRLPNPRVANLVDLARRIDEAITQKNIDVGAFNAALRGKLTNSKNIVDQILAKTRDISDRAANAGLDINAKNAEIANLNAEVAALTTARDNLTAERDELRARLADAAADPAAADALRERIDALEADAENHLQEIRELNDAIDAATIAIAGYLANLSRVPGDQAEVDALADELERNVGAINAQLDNILSPGGSLPPGLAAAAPVVPPGAGPPPPPRGGRGRKRTNKRKMAFRKKRYSKKH